MSDIADRMTSRAAALAREITSVRGQGGAFERIEELILSELQAVLRLERERCAFLADKRAEMWEASLRRYASGKWPHEAMSEARERRNEALFLGDALRGDASDSSSGA